METLGPPFDHTPLKNFKEAGMGLDTGLGSLLDQDEIKHQVKQQLNTILGRSVQELDKVEVLVKELEDTRNQLQETLAFKKTVAPDKITKAIKEAEAALEQENTLVSECDKLEEEVEKHKKEVSSLLEDIGPGVRLVMQLERVRRYRQFVSAICELSREMESAVHAGVEGRALVRYNRLVEVAMAILGTRCKILCSFTMRTLLHWNKVLTHTFSKEFEGVLKSIKWPFTSGSESVHQTPASPESLQRLCTLTEYLLQLVLPDKVGAEVEAVEPSTNTWSSIPGLVCDFKPPVLPVQLLLHPLQVRFFFHFSGSRATNSRENPEWYFTQVLKWISAHDTFLTTRIQPVLERCNHSHINAKVEFMRGLVRMVVMKLANDLPHLQYDDDTFSATVQETLNFERELSLSHGYPSLQPSPLIVLTHPPTFPRWIHVERKFAVEVMDEVLSGEDAWNGGEVGEAAHCGQQLLLLLQGITDRYKRLPQPGHRIQFLELQLDLVDDFRVRVLQVMKSERRDPLASNFPAILNTVHHIAATLHHWADLPFFVEMQYYQESVRVIQEQMKSALGSRDHSTSSFISCSISASSPDDPSAFTLSDLGHSHVHSSLAPEHLARQDALESLNATAESPTDCQLAEVNGSVFDDAIHLYEHIEGDMVNTLASYVFTEVRARSQPYRRDKWFYTASPGSLQMDPVEPSPSLCPLLEVLARHLHFLRDALAPALFVKLWRNIASTLDKYVFEEIILDTRFSDAGAAQFKFDMTRGLFPIFGEFTQKPESFFKQVKESLVLLTLPWPAVVLVRDTIHMWQNDQDAFSLMVSPVKALAEHGITALTPHQADMVLNIRIHQNN